MHLEPLSFEEFLQASEKSGLINYIKKYQFDTEISRAIHDQPHAVRINSDVPNKTSVQVKDHEGNLIRYTLVSIPYYLLGELYRLLNTSDI